MTGTRIGTRVVLGGKAAVFCVHDRQKRQVTTEGQIVALGLTAGIIFDPKRDKIHRCTCCDNLFTDVSDEPQPCHTCRKPLVHALGGPLALPGGVVDG